MFEPTATSAFGKREAKTKARLKSIWWDFLRLVGCKGERSVVSLARCTAPTRREERHESGVELRPFVWRKRRAAKRAAAGQLGPGGAVPRCVEVESRFVRRLIWPPSFNPSPCRARESRGESTTRLASRPSP